MKILITGATGLVGTRLVEKLLDRGYTDIRALTRNVERAQKSSTLPIQFYEWNIKKSYIDSEALEDIDIIFNLAGENIADGRWTEAKKKRILQSRTKAPKLIWDKLKIADRPPQKFISSSAVGIYGNRKDEVLDIHSSFGNDFLSHVCQEWEKAVQENKMEGTKTHCLRTGVVLSDRGGALMKMLPAFKAGIAGKLGNGLQYMSWIHLDDLVDQFIFIMENDLKESAYNGVSPNPVNNIEFTKVLGDVINRPTFLPVPSLALKVLFGEMSTVLLDGQRVQPSQIQAAGFKFTYPQLSTALEDLLKKKNEKELLRYQIVPRPVEEIFNYFSQGKNLEELTPSEMHFKMVGMNTASIQKGSIIDYSLKVHGIPLSWQAKISDYRKNSYFIDEQLKGPYSKWVHVHGFIQGDNGGTIVKDHVRYKIPGGFLGALIAGPFIRKDIKNIFKYRFKTLEKKFSRL